MRRNMCVVAVAVFAAGCSRDIDVHADTDKVRTISVYQARRLVEQKNEMEKFKLPPNPYDAKLNIVSLDGLTRITPQVARELSKYWGCVSLDGLTEITPEVAKELANVKGGMLSLDGLTKLSPEVASALAEYSSQICLNGLVELSPDAARALSGKNRNRETAVTFLGGLRELPPDVAQAFAEHRGTLTFCKSHFDSKNHRAGFSVSYTGITRVSDETADSLARHMGYRNLNALSELSAKALAALRGNEKIRLPDALKQ